jgi:hypothetical protein
MESPEIVEANKDAGCEVCRKMMRLPFPKRLWHSLTGSFSFEKTMAHRQFLRFILASLLSLAQIQFQACRVLFNCTRQACIR